MTDARAGVFLQVYKVDHMQLGPQAWAHWGVCLVTCLLVRALNCILSSSLLQVADLGPVEQHSHCSKALTKLAVSGAGDCR